MKKVAPSKLLFEVLMVNMCCMELSLAFRILAKRAFEIKLQRAFMYNFKLSTNCHDTLYRSRSSDLNNIADAMIAMLINTLRSSFPRQLFNSHILDRKWNFSGRARRQKASIERERKREGKVWKAFRHVSPASSYALSSEEITKPT